MLISWNLGSDHAQVENPLYQCISLSLCMGGVCISITVFTTGIIYHGQWKKCDQKRSILCVIRCTFSPSQSHSMRLRACRWLFELDLSFSRVSQKRCRCSCHLLILDGHNSHVTLEIVKIFMDSSLDIISLPSHTSHALQPLDIACFKPFKTTFRQCRD